MPQGPGQSLGCSWLNPDLHQGFPRASHQAQDPTNLLMPAPTAPGRTAITQQLFPSQRDQRFGTFLSVQKQEAISSAAGPAQAGSCWVVGWRSTDSGRGELGAGLGLRTCCWALPVGTAPRGTPLHAEPPHACVTPCKTKPCSPFPVLPQLFVQPEPSQHLLHAQDRSS